MMAFAYAANKGILQDMALAAADFTRVGVFGHSMGAMATLASAGGSAHGYNPASYSIVAAASSSVASICCCSSSRARKPRHAAWTATTAT